MRERAAFVRDVNASRKSFKNGAIFDCRSTFGHRRDSINFVFASDGPIIIDFSSDFHKADIVDGFDPIGRRSVKQSTYRLLRYARNFGGGKHKK